MVSPTPEVTLPLAAIEQRLQEVEAAGGASRSRAYSLQMWHYLLKRYRGEAVATPGGLPALPYVPVDLSSLGLPLGADDLILDIGCQSGYGLCDFTFARCQAGEPFPMMIGLDYDFEHVAVARAMAPAWADPARVSFIQGDCQHLALAPATVSFAILRLVLPYVRLDAAMRETAAVLKPGGMALFQLHAGGYYRWQARRSWRSPSKLFYYARPLASGLLFRLTGRQPRHRLLAETALAAGTFSRYARRFGLEAVWSHADDPRPMVLLRKLR